MRDLVEAAALAGEALIDAVEAPLGCPVDEDAVRAGLKNHTLESILFPKDPVANAPIRLGVLGLGPKVTLVNLGVDTNVFNEVEDPKEDFTFTVAPALDLWMRTGRGLLTLNGKVEFVYFNQYTSERSINPFGSAQYEYRLPRLTRQWTHLARQAGGGAARGRRAPYAASA